MSNSEKIIKEEIVSLHSFFDKWFKGSIPLDKENFNRFERVLSSDFTIITPEGSIYDKEGITKLLMDSYNRKHDDPEFKIWIDDINIRKISKKTFIANYREWQQSFKNKSGRISTAVFYLPSEQNNEIKWVHVHETWLKNQ